MNHKDPINGKEIAVKSVYIPVKTLLNGKVWSKYPTVLQTVLQTGVSTNISQPIKERKNG